MKKLILLLFFVPLSSLASNSVPGSYGAGSIVELGGSNYTFYDMGDARSGGAWDATIRPVIGTYHLNPSAVEAQLRQLYKSGQKKIVLVLWYMPFTTAPFPGSVQDVWIHVVNSTGGKLTAQHEKNLRAVLRLVKDIGFNEVVLRFGQQGGADPSSTNAPWNAGWSEGQYQENFSFISNTRAVVESELSSTTIKRRYDLGIELGGITDNQAATYTRKMWTDYVSHFGKSDSYGFSFAVNPGRMSQQMAIYDQVGVRPDAYAIDVYDSMDNVLSYVSSELKSAGELSKPVIIQEVYADNADVAQKIINSLKTLSLTIQYIAQWPVSASNTKIDLAPPSQYNSYGGTTAPSGTLAVRPCVLAAGQSVCLVQVNWASSNASNVRVIANGVPFANLANGSADYPSLSLNQVNFQLVSDQGNLDSRSISALPAGTPTLDVQGAELGCDRFQCLTVTGSNIAAGCVVGIFSPDWSMHLADVNGDSCVPDSVTFTIPSAIQQSYQTINLNVNNPNGKWSEPIYASITPPAPVLYKAGLGCDQNQCIWASGSNIAANCTVGLFAPDWSSLLGVLSDVSCQSTGVSFEIPMAVRQNYSAININVNNPYGKWSSPIYVVIK